MGLLFKIFIIVATSIDLAKARVAVRYTDTEPTKRMKPIRYTGSEPRRPLPVLYTDTKPTRRHRWFRSPTENLRHDSFACTGAPARSYTPGCSSCHQACRGIQGCICTKECTATGHNCDHLDNGWKMFTKVNCGRCMPMSGCPPCHKMAYCCPDGCEVDFYGKKYPSRHQCLCPQSLVDMCNAG